ncbi:acyl carrier protein [Flavobacterium sp. 3HN19-14]|uniref:acyl carrier protein n=1 Tax=Flavobacterium sp. 3HN19-14 TaxID=3448133 RepID=UPI003EDFE30A
MTREIIIGKLKIIVKPYVREQEAFESLTENTDFINDLKINSANLVDIILDIEETFEITIDTPEMEKMLDVKSTIDLIESKI